MRIPNRTLALGALLLLLVMLPFAAAAKTCLVLGGGGARGIAHIGVIRVLERERVPIDCITGTSMGAIVGGLYAAGYRADEIEALLKDIDWRDVFRDDPPRREFTVRRKEDDLDLLVKFDIGLRGGRLVLPRGAIQGQKMLLLLRRLTLPVWDIDDFDALPIPFRAVAADIAKGQPRVFSGGDLAVAIRASMSVPGVLAPIRVDGQMLVDGGIVNNVPVDIARAMGADRVIVVDVGTQLLPEEDLTSPLAITGQMLDALMLRQTQLQLDTLTERDLLIRPELGDIKSGDFEREEESIPIGMRAAESKRGELATFAVDEATFAAHLAARRHPSFDPPMIEFLATRTGRSRTADYVAQRVSEQGGKTLDVDALENDILRAYGDGSYERITWNLTERGGKTGVEVEPVDKGWGPNYVRFGLSLSDDFEGRNDYLLQGQLRFTGLNTRGAEWRNRVSLGRITGLRTEFYQPWGNLGQYFGDGYAEYRALDQPIVADGIDVATYRLKRSVLGGDVGAEVGNATRVMFGVERGRDELARSIGSPDLPADVTSDFGDIFLGVTRDTLDDSEFPTEGSRVDTRLEMYRNIIGTEVDADVIRVAYDKALSRGRSRFLLGLRGNYTADDDADLLQTSGLLGGFLNLSGFNERELVGDHLGYGRVVYYRLMTDDSGIFSQPLYFGGSIETGNVWASRDDIGVDSLIWSGSVFVGMESFLGPIFVGYGRAETGDSAVYLNFGSIIRSAKN